MNNKHSVWLIPASPRHFDIEGCFNQYGRIFWLQENNLSNAKVGDTGFIYCTSPIKAIRYSFEISETCVPYSSELDVEDSFSLNNSFNRDHPSSLFLTVKLTGKTQSSDLTFERLLEHGLKGSVMGAMRISNSKYKKLYMFINDNF